MAQCTYTDQVTGDACDHIAGGSSGSVDAADVYAILFIVIIAVWLGHGVLKWMFSGSPEERWYAANKKAQAERNKRR